MRINYERGSRDDRRLCLAAALASPRWMDPLNYSARGKQ